MNTILKNKKIALVLTACISCMCACSSCSDDKDDTGKDDVEKVMPRYIIAGYLPEYKIDFAEPGDMSYIRVSDRVYYFGLYPTEAGEWQLNTGYERKLGIVRAALLPSQELFVVAGGGATATPNMHVMGTDPARREAYAEALVNYAHDYNFDGIDMDWETDWSVSPARRVNVEDFVDLMTRIRNKMDALPEGTTVKKLTTALATQADSRELAAAIKDIVDQINVMVYDVYGAEEDGYPHAPMDLFVAALDNYVAAGLPKEKLLGGVPFYGGKRMRGENGIVTTETKSYAELYEQSSGDMTAAMNEIGGFQFNGPNLLKQKTQYVLDNGYGGMMMWEMTQDIYKTEEFSLHKAIRETIDAYLAK